MKSTIISAPQIPSFKGENLNISIKTQAKSALLHTSANPEDLQCLEGHFSSILPSACSRACSQTNLSPGLPELPSHISPNQQKDSGAPASKDDERFP